MDYYLSIVATTRNDNHGGDLLKRTTEFVESVFYQAKKWQLPVELILVEWNPPINVSLLQEVLPKPGKDIPVLLKYVVVPPEIHAHYKHASVIPLYQMIAKNVGIKRALGEYILCTNIDIIFSDASFGFFAERQFKKGEYYRAHRCDIPKKVMDLSSMHDKLNFAEKNILKRFGKSYRHETLVLPRFIYYFPRVSIFLNAFALWLWTKTHPNQFPHFRVDFDACGDFTLMSKQDWEDIEGYPELDMYSIHIDSMGVWAANALGKKQVILPYKAPIYHIYHEDGWESEDAIRTIKFLENKPSLDYSIVFKGGMQLVKEKKTWGLNKPNWGMSDLDLPIFEFKGKIVSNE